MKDQLTDNEVIALFMGGVLVNDAADEFPEGYYVWPGGDWSSKDELYYDTDWSDLMPVVEKIEGLHDASYLVRIVSRRCIIYDSNIANQADVYQGNGDGIIASSINQESKLIACYKAILEFIRWHNAQSKL